MSIAESSSDAHTLIEPVRMPVAVFKTMRNAAASIESRLILSRGFFVVRGGDPLPLVNAGHAFKLSAIAAARKLAAGLAENVALERATDEAQFLIQRKAREVDLDDALREFALAAVINLHINDD